MRTFVEAFEHKSVRLSNPFTNLQRADSDIIVYNAPLLFGFLSKLLNSVGLKFVLFLSLSLVYSLKHDLDK